MTSNDERIPYCPPEKVAQQPYDIILIVAGEAGKKRAAEIRKKLCGLGLDESCFLFDFVAIAPGFSWGKYQKLKRAKVSILSFNCFGGFLSHSLALPFRSPTVNMFFNEDEYVRMLRYPRLYLRETLEYEKDGWEESLKIKYPIYRLGDILVYMNHYPDYQEAEKKWYERVRRINWYNLFVVMYTERQEILERFDALPFAKKVCFVPFSSSLDPAWQIDKTATGKELPLWDAVNHFGMGKPWSYDPFDMLLYGKKTIVRS